MSRHGWQANLNLQFRRSGCKTLVSRRSHKGPLRIQKPFYPPDGVCHVYILHPPGGVVGGDELGTSVEVFSNASALITTPASAKIYRSAGATSQITCNLKVGEGASLEWLPQDTVLFGGSRVHQATTVRLEPGSHFCGWEICSMGRPASGDDYSTGEFEQVITLLVDEVPRLIERQQWSAGDAVLSAPWGLNGHLVLGSFYGFPADKEVLRHTRELIDGKNFCDMAATLVDDVLVIRALADDAFALREELTRLWSAIRMLINGFSPGVPRIWAT